MCYGRKLSSRYFKKENTYNATSCQDCDVKYFSLDNLRDNSHDQTIIDSHNHSHDDELSSGQRRHGKQNTTN